MNCMFNWWALVHSSIVYLMAAFAECWLSKKAVIASKLSNFMLMRAIRRDIEVWDTENKLWIYQSSVFLPSPVETFGGKRPEAARQIARIGKELSRSTLGVRSENHDKPSIPGTQSYPPKRKLTFDFESFNRHSSPRPSRALLKCGYWYICQNDVTLSDLNFPICQNCPCLLFLSRMPRFSSPAENLFKKKKKQYPQTASDNHWTAEIKPIS